jgi:hypothetical protein
VPKYVIRVKGNLAQHWSRWFADMTIANEANGDATLTGLLADQSALYGVLAKVRDLGLPLFAVTTVVSESPPPPGAPRTLRRRRRCSKPVERLPWRRKNGS